jgi:hypothetical protein
MIDFLLQPFRFGHRLAVKYLAAMWAPLDSAHDFSGTVRTFHGKPQLFTAWMAYSFRLYTAD